MDKMHRYVSLRKKLLGVDELHMYDVYVSMIPDFDMNVTYDEAKELVDLARAKKLFVFEAITVLHNDVIAKMKENLPRLGQIRMMLANYSQYSSRYDNYLKGVVDHSFDPKYLGGALRDINVYNIHYAVELFGTPQKTHYYPNTGFNGIDVSGTMVLEYDGFSAVCTGGKDSDSPCFVQISQLFF